MSAIAWIAVRCCSGVWKKTADRYCDPTSAPWRSRVVGSWIVKNTSSRSRNEIRAGSNVICTTSACPVWPEHTCS